MTGGNCYLIEDDRDEGRDQGKHSGTVYSSRTGGRKRFGFGLAVSFGCERTCTHVYVCGMGAANVSVRHQHGDVRATNAFCLFSLTWEPVVESLFCSSNSCLGSRLASCVTTTVYDTQEYG